jgi:hypothetical protein
MSDFCASAHDGTYVSSCTPADASTGVVWSEIIRATTDLNTSDYNADSNYGRRTSQLDYYDQLSCNNNVTVFLCATAVFNYTIADDIVPMLAYSFRMASGTPLCKAGYDVGLSQSD